MAHGQDQERSICLKGGVRIQMSYKIQFISEIFLVVMGIITFMVLQLRRTATIHQVNLEKMIITYFWKLEDFSPGKVKIINPL